MVGDGSRRAREQIEWIPRGDVETGCAGQHGVPHGGRQIRSVMVEHLAHEERVAAGDPVQPGRIDVALTHQCADGLQAQRRHDQRLRVRGARNVTEQRPQRMGDADLVVAGDAYGQQLRLSRRAAVETETGRWCPGRPTAGRREPGPTARSELVEHRREDVVGLIAVSNSCAVVAPNWSARSCSGPSGLGVDSGSHAPHSTRSSSSHRPTNASTNDVLPPPDSPHTITAPPRPARAAAARVASCSSSCSRSVSFTVGIVPVTEVV